MDGGWYGLRGWMDGWMDGMVWYDIVGLLIQHSAVR